MMDITPPPMDIAPPPSPPDARVAWHRLVMSSVFMDPVYKKQLAIILANNYTTLQRNFLADSQDHDVCVSRTTALYLL